MEPGSQAGALQEILDCLCRESDPGKIYKTLKKLSSVPILCDSLAEIGFRKTIKTLKNQQLLLPFVKDLVDKWSPGFVLGPQQELDSLDFGLLRSHRTAHQSTGLEETNQEQIFQVSRVAWGQVFFGLSKCYQGWIHCLIPSCKSNRDFHPQTHRSPSLDPAENRSSEQQPAVRDPGQVGIQGASFEEPLSMRDLWAWGSQDSLRKARACVRETQVACDWRAKKQHSSGPREWEEATGTGWVLDCLNSECWSPSTGPTTMQEEEWTPLAWGSSEASPKDSSRWFSSIQGPESHGWLC